MPDILESTWEDSAGIMREFRTTSYCQKVLNLYGKLRTEELYQSSLHGQGHIERVILLGGVLVWKESLPDLETSMLLAACAYHDIGRINDGVDREHGCALRGEWRLSACCEILLISLQNIVRPFMLQLRLTVSTLRNSPKC